MTDTSDTPVDGPAPADARDEVPDAAPVSTAVPDAALVSAAPEAVSAVTPVPSPAPYLWTTPEPVRAGPAPGYVFVGFWRRFFAFLIDGVILTIGSYAILIPIAVAALTSADAAVLFDRNSYVVDPTTGLAMARPEALAAIRAVMPTLLGQMLIAMLLVLLLQMLYHAILWSWRGGTLGQLALGIQIRNEATGRRIGFWRACLRYVGFLISSWILFLGFVWIAFDGRKQGWHDKIAGTLVVRRVG